MVWFYAAHNDRGWQGKEVAVYRPQQAVGYFSHHTEAPIPTVFILVPLLIESCNRQPKFYAGAAVQANAINTISASNMEDR